MEQTKQKSSGRWKLFAVIAICASPLVASYLTYYVIKPEGRTNYGSLIDPRNYPIPALGATELSGESTGLEAYRGKWIMLQVSDADCREPCPTQLHDMRQLRLAQGKDMDRVERVWLVTDDKPIDTMLIREFDGTHILRVKREVLEKWLPTPAESTAADHIFMIDPLGNLMMRFPKNADPNRIKKDLSKLLKASRIG